MKMRIVRVCARVYRRALQGVQIAGFCGCCMFSARTLGTAIARNGAGLLEV